MNQELVVLQGLVVRIPLGAQMYDLNFLLLSLIIIAHFFDRILIFCSFYHDLYVML